MGRSFAPPQLAKGTGLRAFLVALGGTALLLALVLTFNVADLVEQRRHSEAWTESKEAQVVRLLEWRRALAPGGLLRLGEDVLADYGTDLQAVRDEFPDEFGAVLAAIDSWRERSREARDAYDRAVEEVRRTGVLSFGTMRPGELPEQQAALRQLEIAALALRAVYLDFWPDLRELLREEGLPDETRNEIVAFLRERWETSRNRLAASTQASAHAAGAALEVLDVVEEAAGQWYFENRTGFPVFEDDGQEIAFNRRMNRLGETLGMAIEARPRLVPVD